MMTDDPKTGKVRQHADDYYGPRSTPLTETLPPAINDAGPWRCSYGIHCGTLVSRDSRGAGREFEDYAAVVAWVKELIDSLARIHYLLWFATARNAEGQEVTVSSGHIYH